MKSKHKPVLVVIIVLICVMVLTIGTVVLIERFGKAPIKANDISRAYEIAIDNGYEGTRVEFIEAISKTGGKDHESGKKYPGIASVEIEKSGKTIVRLDNGIKIEIIDATKESSITADESQTVSTESKTYQDDKTETYYTVLFEDDDGTVLKTEKVLKGSSAVAPDAPYKEGYAFSKWNKDFSRVTANLTIKPVFEKIVKPAVVLQTVYAKKGSDTVKVNVNLLNNPGIASIVADISFDKGLKLVDVEFNKSELKKCMLTTPEPFANPQRLSILNTNANFNYSGTIATLTFQLDNKLQSGDSREIRITYKQGNIFDINMKNVKFETVNGKIIIK